MGHMIDGTWHTGWFAPDPKGAFQRPATKFHGRITADGPHPPESGRYHLYVSYACPWAHRTLLVRALRGLENAISVSAVVPEMGEDGWEFPAASLEPIFGARYLREIYAHADPHFTGRVTVPVLWDKRTNSLVNNESREVMRMLDTELEELAEDKTTLAPAELLPEIERVLSAIYDPINNGVYRAGFATSQQAYEEACRALFGALDHWEKVLERQPYLCGNVLTEADVALFTTLVRFDLVYYAHFKCNLRRIADLPNLSRYVSRIYQLPKVAETCHFDEIKRHYYWSQTAVNPTRIVPIGPEVRF